MNSEKEKSKNLEKEMEVFMEAKENMLPAAKYNSNS